MKTFNNMSRQGDILIIKVNDIPAKSKKIDFDFAEKKVKDNSDWVLAHSETGHHHVVNSEFVNYFESANDPLSLFIEVKKDVELRHLRGFDTHESQIISKGKYHIRKQRRKSVEGWERVAD